jgi:hypothetical protein
MGSRQPKQYYRHQQAYDENHHGRPAELAHQIIQTNSATGPRPESAGRLSLGGFRDQMAPPPLTSQRRPCLSSDHVLRQLRAVLASLLFRQRVRFVRTAACVSRSLIRLLCRDLRYQAITLVLERESPQPSKHRFVPCPPDEPFQTPALPNRSTAIRHIAWPHQCLVGAS